MADGECVLKNELKEENDATGVVNDDDNSNECHERLPSVDPELDDLLEDALHDFEKQESDRQQSTFASQKNAECLAVSESLPTDASSSSTATTTSTTPASSMPDVKEMEQLLMSLMGDDAAGLSQQLNQFGLPTSSIESSTATSDLAETMQRTLGDLARSANDIQSDDLFEEELFRLMSSLTTDGGECSGGDADLFPMMQGMMKSLLSKDVLYPSLKEISSQYPTWLSSHRETITGDEFSRYQQQYELMTNIVQEFEAETSTDSDEIKRSRFERVLDIMQKMQTLGQPPKELIGELPAGVELDEEGLPTLSSAIPSPEQCNLM